MTAPATSEAPVGQKYDPLKPTRLENWVMFTEADPYTAPEIIEFRLHGDVRNHQRINDADGQTISRILGRTESGRIVTRNTVYELGDPKPDYEAQFPNAKARLLATLPITP